MAHSAQTQTRMDYFKRYAWTTEQIAVMEIKGNLRTAMKARGWRKANPHGNCIVWFDPSATTENIVALSLSSSVRFGARA